MTKCDMNFKPNQMSAIKTACYYRRKSSSFIHVKGSTNLTKWQKLQKLKIAVLKLQNRVPEYFVKYSW